MSILALSPSHWNDYELIDCGNFEKLERFGKFILRRPEPQALWSPVYSDKIWKERTNVLFESGSSHKGIWKKDANFKEPWSIKYKYQKKEIAFKLMLTSFKHVGIFPEQAENWDYIIRTIGEMPGKPPKVLNLFAYTGGASLAAKAAGADVVHVDSVKQVISWAKENMELSNLKDIRWTVEDAMKFVEREVKRGNTYQGIILDPPAYGIGAKGERWKLEEQINDLLKMVSQLLDPQRNFLILNTYSMGFSSLISENLIRSNFKHCDNLETGELFLKATSGVKLPLGVFARLHHW
jgi:23S rRNA (cytosine1962-C5)-methyltransferase